MKFLNFSRYVIENVVQRCETEKIVAFESFVLMYSYIGT